MDTIDKPSNTEDEFFKKQNLELLRQQRERLDAARAKAERTSHWMKCPKCGHDLAEREHQHVKIDVCANCGGVWLDAGELEQIKGSEADASGSSFLGNLFGWSK